MRGKLIDPSFKGALIDFMKHKIRLLDCIPYAVGGTSDHIHCLLHIPPRKPVAECIGEIKGASSYWINHREDAKGGFAWQTSYGLFTVSPHDQRNIVEYILNQEFHHRKGALREDLELLDTAQ